MEYRKLPGIEQEVSLLGLGTYETLRYLEYADIVRLIEVAVDVGINLFDVAHYPKSPHTEVILSRALKDAGLAREDYVLTTKVWGRDSRSLDQELTDSLFRLGVDYVDGVLSYGPRWDQNNPEEHGLEAAGLVSSGRVGWWGGLNWSGRDIASAQAAIDAVDGAQPKIMQLKYNVARRNIAESDEYIRLWKGGSMLLQASDSLEGGTLAGRSDSQRILGRDPGQIRSTIIDSIPALQVIAQELDLSLSQLAIIFAAAFPYSGNVLVGASKPEQLRENASAISKVSEIGQEVRKKLDAIKIDGHRLDVPPGSEVGPDQSPYELLAGQGRAGVQG